MKVSRSYTRYIFMVPFTGCAALGLYSIYDTPAGAYVKNQSWKGINYIYDKAIKTYLHAPVDWQYQSTVTPPEDPKRKPPPMPY